MSFALYVNGDNNSYTDWQSASLTRSIEHPAARFSFSAPHPQQNVNVKVQDTVEVEVDGTTETQGKIFSITGTGDSENATRSFNGRSTLADAIDSSVPLQPGLWENISSKQIIEQLLKPYPIKSEFLTLPEGTTGLRTNPGDTVFSSINKLLERENLLSFELKPGILTIDRAPESGSIDTLRFGTQDVVALAEFNLDISNRFHKIIVVGEGIFGSDMMASGQAIDETIDNNRTLVIQLSGNADNARCQQVADYEIAVRAARSFGFSYRVPTWYTSQQKLWLPNNRVNIEDDDNNINGEHLLVTVTLNETDEDEWAILKFAPPESYTLKPPQPPVEDSLFN